MAKLRRQLALAGIGLLVALAVVVVRLALEANTAYRQGAAAEERGELADAVRHYLDAGRAYVPGNPVMRRTLDRLDAIGVAAVTRGDYAAARSAFEAERAALLGTRSFYTPHAERLPAINRSVQREEIVHIPDHAQLARHIGHVLVDQRKIFGPLSVVALLAARRSGKQSWQVDTAAGPMPMLPFTAIGEQQYSTYVVTTT